MLATLDGERELVALWPVLPAVICFYAAGLLWNDVADRDEDAEARPDRPIPSGRVGARTVAVVGCLLAAIGLALVAFAGGQALPVAGALVLLVALYTFGPHRRGGEKTTAGRILVATNMGACRAASLLLGASVAGLPFSGTVWGMALGLGIVIGGITMTASRETSRVQLGSVRWMPALGVLTVTVVGAMGGGEPPSMLILAGACALMLFQGHALRGHPEPRVVGPRIGAMIRLLLPLQAGMILCVGEQVAFLLALVLLCAWPLSVMLGKSFSGS
jgi:4-hydroxybenzoate polyprenyltransferase